LTTGVKEEEELEVSGFESKNEDGKSKIDPVLDPAQTRSNQPESPEVASNGQNLLAKISEKLGKDLDKDTRASPNDQNQGDAKQGLDGMQVSMV
jgi:hypothetical protein